jgi:hypothetical protein
VGSLARRITVAGVGGGTGRANTDRHESALVKIPATIAGVRSTGPSRSRSCGRTKL